MAFANMHPIVNMVYFVLVFLFAMLGYNPFVLIILFAGALLYAAMLYPFKSLLKGALTTAVLFVLMAVINPLFSHRGVTVLFYLKNGNAITLEACAYGLAIALMIVTAMLWFLCLNKVLTQSKLIYIFGRISPNLGLLISMALGFIPKLRECFKELVNAQKSLDENAFKGPLKQRLRLGSRLLSALIGQSLEGGIDTAVSMNSRGYGLKGRTSYSIYTFSKRDGAFSGVLIILATIIGYGFAGGFFEFNYYPRIYYKGGSIGLYLALSAFALLPVIFGLVEELRWNSLKSRA